MASRRRPDRSIDRIDAIDQDGVDDRTARHRILAELRRTVPFDVHVWVLTDPETEVGASPLADAPVPADLPRLIRAKYLTPVNRWTGLRSRVATLLAATDGRPDRSLVWREVLSAYGVSDVASMVLRDRYGCWGWLDLWRIGADPFSAEEQALLTDLAGPITAAVRRSQARTFDRPPAGGPRPGPIVLVLSPDLEVRAQTPETDRYLRSLVPPADGQPPVPAGALNVAAQLLARAAGIDAHEPWARVHLDGGRWLTLRAARVRATGEDAGDLAVTIEDASPAERRHLFARSHALSRRETEVLEQLTLGGDNRAMAATLFISEHTVHDHLKAIYEKTGASSRSGLLARLSGG